MENYHDFCLGFGCGLGFDGLVWMIDYGFGLGILFLGFGFGFGCGAGYKLVF